MDKLRQFISDVLDWLNPHRVQYRRFCRWMDDAERAIEDRDFYDVWKDVWKREVTT